MPKELSDQQRKFCTEYVKTGDAANSARSAGYSDKTAASQGCQLIKRPYIAAEITRLRGKLEKKSELDAAKVLAAANNLMDFDPADLFADGGKLLRIKEMPLEARRAIQSIDYEKQTIKFVPRLGALELSAKLIGMLRNEPQQQTAIQIIVSPTMRDPEPESAPIVPVWE